MTINGESGLKSTYVSHTCTNHLIIGNIFSILLSPGFWMKSRRMRSTNYEILCEHKIWISKKTRPISQFSLDKKRRNLGLFSYALKLGILFHNCSSCQYRTLQVWIYKNKLASLEATLVKTITDSLTGVTCRATSEAKKKDSKIWLKCSKWETGGEVIDHHRWECTSFTLYWSTIIIFKDSLGRRTLVKSRHYRWFVSFF